MCGLSTTGRQEARNEESLLPLIAFFPGRVILTAESHAVGNRDNL